MPENGGIAAAINAGVQLLEKEGVQYLWIFDQDSQPCSQALAAMLHTLKQQHASDSETTAAVVPLIHDLHGRQTLPYLVALPQGRIVTAPHRTNAPVLAAIASGMLIPITAWQHIGPMNEALFAPCRQSGACVRATWVTTSPCAHRPSSTTNWEKAKQHACLA
jgi:rhamnosyltransferase